MLIQEFLFQLKHYGFKRWRSSYWNVCDVFVIILYFLGFIMRMTNDRMLARIVYTVDLMLFIVRVLEVFLVDKTLGSYVILIERMVSNIITSETLH